jgi:hypothetical protein
MKNAVFWDIKPQFVPHREHITSPLQSSAGCAIKISGFHGAGNEECLLLLYKIPVCASQETHYISATKLSQLMLLRFAVFTAVAMKNATFWDKTPCGPCENQPADSYC